MFDDYPFDKLIEELISERDLSRSPIFDVMVSMSVTSGKKHAREKRSSGPGNFAGNEVKVGSSHDLAFIFYECDQNITINITYNSDLFNEDRIHRMCRHFMNILDGVMIKDDAPLDDIELLTQEEKKEILFFHFVKSIRT